MSEEFPEYIYERQPKTADELIDQLGDLAMSKAIEINELLAEEVQINAGLRSRLDALSKSISYLREEKDFWCSFAFWLIFIDILCVLVFVGYQFAR